MRIQLTWTDPSSGQAYQPVFDLPIALGRSFGLMPGSLDGQAVSRVVLADNQVEIYHALLKEQDGAVVLESQANASLSVNGIAFQSVPLQEGDRIQIGPFELTYKLPEEEVATAPAETMSPPFAPEDPPPPSTAAPPEPVAMGGTQALSGLASGLSSSAVGGSVSGNWRCDRKVGFLFKRPCERTTPQGCPYCRNGQANNDPYFYDYDLYPNYGRYGRGYWGYSYYRDRDRYSYNSASRNVDFTEADAASFEDETDTDYETSFGDS